MSAETVVRERLCMWGRSLFERGLSSGSSGNMSVRVADGYLVTPTNSCLGLLDPARLSKLDLVGAYVSGDRPSKEVPMHLAFYKGRPEAGAVVHLHSSYATAWSCLSDIDPENTLPPLTPYVLMRAGKVPLVPYFEPGSPRAESILKPFVANHSAVLLANHGPVVAAANLDAAVFAAEEIEEAAKVALFCSNIATQTLAPEAVERLLGRQG